MYQSRPRRRQPTPPSATSPLDAMRTTLQDFMDPRMFNQKNVLKVCKRFLLPGGTQIPFCAYNSVGYREQARAQLAARQRARQRVELDGVAYVPQPLAF